MTCPRSTLALCLALTLASATTTAHAADAPYTAADDWTDMDTLVFDHAARQGVPGEATGIVIGALYNKYRVDQERDANGRTPLMVAAASGNEEFVRVALSGDAAGIIGGPLEVGAIDADGRTAMDHARAAGHASIVSLLEAGPQSGAAGSATQVQAPGASTPTPHEDATGRSGPLGLAFFSPLALGQRRTKDHYGLSLSVLYGSHRSLRGTQIGTINHTRNGGIGLQAGVATWTGGPFYGVQVAAFNFSPDRARLGARGKRPPGCYGICVAGGQIHGGGAGLHTGVLNGVNEADGILMVGMANAGTRRVRGAMIGAGNHVTHDFDGLQIGVFNWNNFVFEQTTYDYGSTRVVESTVTTWQGHSRGVQISVWNTADRIDGVQIGAWNFNQRQTRGVQIGALNIARYRPDPKVGAGSGLQLGGVNLNGDFKGVQIGLINIARKLDGMQLGGLNIAWKNKVPVTVVFNAG